MNSYFCELQFQVIGKYKMADRIQVVCSDICNQASLLQEADVIVLNNVFEFFCSPEDQARYVWSEQNLVICSFDKTLIWLHI